MSATVVEIRKPFWRIEDLLDRIRETWEEIPSPDAHLDADDDDNECVGDWEGATPDGYAYAPGSEVEIQQALQLLMHVERLLSGVCEREWPRCPNGSDGQTYEQFKREQARLRAERG